MNQDIFLITAIDMYNKSERAADEAYRTYHRLIDPTSKFAESVWALYILHTRVSRAIAEEIQIYKNSKEKIH